MDDHGSFQTVWIATNVCKKKNLSSIPGRSNNDLVLSDHSWLSSYHQLSGIDRAFALSQTLSHRILWALELLRKQHTSASLRWILYAYGSKSCVPHSATNPPQNRFFRATQLSTCVAPAKMCWWQKIERITRQFGEAQPCTGQLCSISSSSRNVETRALNAFFLLNWWILDIIYTYVQQTSTNEVHFWNYQCLSQKVSNCFRYLQC